MTHRVEERKWNEIFRFMLNCIGIYLFELLLVLLVRCVGLYKSLPLAYDIFFKVSANIIDWSLRCNNRGLRR